MLTREVLETIAIPELAEMIELAGNPETWLAKLLAAHSALFQPPRVPHKPKGDVTQPLIVAVTVVIVSYAVWVARSTRRREREIAAATRAELVALNPN